MRARPPEQSHCFVQAFNNEPLTFHSCSSLIDCRQSPKFLGPLLRCTRVATTDLSHRDHWPQTMRDRRPEKFIFKRAADNDPLSIFPKSKYYALEVVLSKPLNFHAKTLNTLIPRYLRYFLIAFSTIYGEIFFKTLKAFSPNFSKKLELFLKIFRTIVDIFCHRSNLGEKHSIS